jgi:DNA-binding response OmpR family regulator
VDGNGSGKDAVCHRVLIVDDEVQLLDVLGEHFRNVGYDVHTAAEIEEAEALLANYSYSLVITDLALSRVGFRGLDILDRAWDICERPKIIVLTGHCLPEMRVEVATHGADAFVPKPVRLVSLAEVAARLLGASA